MTPRSDALTALIETWRTYRESDRSEARKEREVAADSRGWFLRGRAEGFKACADELSAVLRRGEATCIPHEFDHTTTPVVCRRCQEPWTGQSALRRGESPEQPERLSITASADEIEFLAVAAGLRAQSVEEYVKRAINASLRKQGVDAVLFRESDDE